MSFPKGMEALIDKATAAYERDIRKSSKSTQRVDKANEDLLIYDHPAGKYQQNTRAFSSPADQSEFDFQWSDASSNEKIIQTKFQKGKTSRGREYNKMN